MQSTLLTEVGGQTPAWFLSALAQDAETGHSPVNGARIAWRAWGEAGSPGIVLVHGGAAHARWWDHVAPLLVEQTRRVVAVDLSGHGDSDHRERYHLDAWVEEVLAAGEDAGIVGAPVVVGHSMGGFVALRAGMIHASRMAGVVVVDSPLREPTPEETAARAGQAFGPLHVYPDRAQAVSRFRPIPDQPVLDYVAGNVAAHSLREVDGGWTWKFDPGIFRFGLRGDPILTRVQTPVALVRGERGILPRDLSPLAVDLVGDAPTFIEIPDAGHHIMLDQPLALVAALRTLLADWPRPHPPSRGE